MLNRNGESESFWKTIKIKELPVKEEVDRRSVLLIEDDQDTKQMSVDIFYKAIEDAADKMLDMIIAKLLYVESFMEEMRKKDEQYAANEAERQKNEEQRIQDEQERREQFEEWIRIWEEVWTPFITKL